MWGEVDRASRSGALFGCGQCVELSRLLSRCNGKLDERAEWSFNVLGQVIRCGIGT